MENIGKKWSSVDKENINVWIKNKMYEWICNVVWICAWVMYYGIMLYTNVNECMLELIIY